MKTYGVRKFIVLDNSEHDSINTHVCALAYTNNIDIIIYSGKPEIAKRIANSGSGYRNISIKIEVRNYFEMDYYEK